MKSPLFYLAKEEIQNGKIKNNIDILNFPAPFYAEFPCLQDKRAGISKKILLFVVAVDKLKKKNNLALRYDWRKCTYLCFYFYIFWNFFSSEFMSYLFICHFWKKKVVVVYHPICIYALKSYMWYSGKEPTLLPISEFVLD